MSGNGITLVKGSLEIVGQEKRSGYNHRPRPVPRGMEHQDNIYSKGVINITAKRGSQQKHKTRAARGEWDPQGNKEFRSCVGFSKHIMGPSVTPSTGKNLGL